MVKKTKVKRKQKKTVEVVEKSLQVARQRMAEMQEIVEEKPEKKSKFAIGAGGRIVPIGLAFEDMDISSREQVVKNLMKNTLAVKLQLWMVNLRVNLAEKFFEEATDIREELKRTGPAIIVGNGPSLYDFHHIREIVKAKKQGKFEGTIISTDSAFFHCVDNGLIPDYVCSTDGDPSRIHQFYNFAILRECKGETKAVLMDTVSPNVFRKVMKELNLDVLTFMGFYDNIHELDSLTKAIHFLTGHTVMHVGGNVGAWSWHYAMFLGCRPVALIGMDYAYRANTPLEATAYYPHLTYAFRHIPDEEQRKKIIATRFRIVRNKFFRRTSLTSQLWEGYRDIFLRYSRAAKTHQGVQTYNCTGNGILFDTEERSIIQMKLGTFIEKFGTAKKKKVKKHVGKHRK